MAIGTQRKIVFWSVFLCLSLFLLWVRTSGMLDADENADMLFGILGGMVMGWVFGVYGEEYAYSWKITDVHGTVIASTIKYHSRQAAMDSAIVASWKIQQPISLKIIEY